MGFFSILTLIFITLKLTNIITWSWWLVLLPILPVTFIISFVVIGFIIALLAGEKITIKRKNNG